jgi:hypothetical protein
MQSRLRTFICKTVIRKSAVSGFSYQLQLLVSFRTLPSVCQHQNHQGFRVFRVIRYQPSEIPCCLFCQNQTDRPAEAANNVHAKICAICVIRIIRDSNANLVNPLSLQIWIQAIGTDAQSVHFKK